MNRLLLSLFLPVCLMPAALAAGPGDAADAATPPAPEALPGTPAEREMISEASRLDEVSWVDDALMLHRAARRGTPRGSVLLLGPADGGPARADRLGQLRTTLNLHGWHTWFLRLPGTQDDVAAFARISAALAALRQSVGGTVLVVTEGKGGHWLAACAGSDACALRADGLVLLNYPDSADLPDGAFELIEALTLPTLIVQEDPRSWQPEYPLGRDTELHLLPPGRSNRADDRMVRRVRGWLERRFG